MPNSSPDQFYHGDFGPHPTADPLRAVGYLSKLPQYNLTGAKGQVPRTEQGLIVGGLEDITEYGLGLNPAVFEESGIALRALHDLDTGMSSVRVFDKDPVGRVRGLAQLAMRLSVAASKADGAPWGIYRSTFDSYVMPRILPDGTPSMFTGSDAELLFLTVLNGAYFNMLDAATTLTDVDFVHDDPRDILKRLEMSAEKLELVFNPMMSTFNKYHKDSRSNGHSFATGHRPFFDPIYFARKRLDAPSAAQSPLEEIEAALRAMNDSGLSGSMKAFHTFFDHNIVYMPEHRRSRLDRFADENDHTTYFEYICGLPDSSTKADLAAAYIRNMEVIVKQRKAHNGATARDFAGRAEGSKGGAGFDPSDLDDIESESQTNLELMRTIYEKTQRHASLLATA